MLKLAKSDLTVHVDEFDGDEYKINCKNGYLDLHTGALAEHNPGMLLMKRVNASYDPEAKCPNWNSFIDAVCLGDKELIDWMQRLCGYLMTGSVKQQQFYIMYGEGGNGKGTLNEVLMHVLGNYSAPTQSEIFLASNTSSTRALEIVGRLKGIRFATASEVGAASRWSEETVKQLTGEDTITGASMYSPRFDFTPTAKIVFQINHLPMFRDASYGFKRRMCVIPFKAKFEGDAKDLDLKPKLKKERDGIFGWLVEGARRYLEQGLDDVPAVIREATERYIEDNDTLSPFINAELVKEAGAKVYVGDAYLKYVGWCRRNDTEAASKDLFVKRMEERGIYRGKKDMKGTPFIGHKLKVDAKTPIQRSIDLSVANHVAQTPIILEPLPSEPSYYNAHGELVVLERMFLDSEPEILLE
ncbi:DNA primase family protein [Leptospira interrogans]